MRYRSFGNRSFEEYCRDMNRTKTLSFWDKKNDLPPDGVSKYGWKTVFMKCPECGNEWTEELQVLMNVSFSEDWCPICAKKHTIEQKKNVRCKKVPRAVRPRVVPPEISNCVAVIDVETTWRNEVMSIGAVIVDTQDKYRILEVAYWLVSPFCYQPAMFSGAIDLSLAKGRSFFYQKGVRILDLVTETEDSFENCIEGLQKFLDRYDVSSCFAYNGHFDKRHLLDLDGVSWFDLVVPFTSLDLNPFLSSQVFPDYCLGGGKAGLRLVRDFSFSDIMRHIPGCKRNYHETHNGCIDAFDEAMAMQLINLPRDEYRVGWIRDTKFEKERRIEAEERRSVLKIPFSETIAMSYEDYVDYLLKKHGKARDDYFVIMPKEKWLSSHFDEWRYRYCGDYVLRDGEKYPVSGTKYKSFFAEDGVGDIFDDKTYWYSPEDKFFICWGRNGNYSRTPEGLLCHHIDEDKASVLSNPRFAKDYPFSYQKRERLVYCDYVEHLLLHHKIKGDECSGFDVIAEEIRQFLHGNIPYDWQVMCVQRMLRRLDDIRLLRSEGILNLDEGI